MPELFSYWADAKEATLYCNGMNEWIAEQVRNYPDSFVGLGIAPLQDVEMACEALQHAKDIGLTGVEVGSTVTKDQSYAEVESVKAVSDVIAPLSGEIVEVNEGLKDSPEQINDDSYGEGWLVKVKLSDQSELDSLLDAAGYQESLS